MLNKINGNRKAILFLSEISGVRASCFRQEKIVKAFLDNNYKVIIVNCSKIPAIVLNFDNVSDFDQYRQHIRDTIKSPASIRQGAIIKLIRHLKHFLILDITNPIQWLSFLFTFLKNKKEFKNPYVIAGSTPSITCLLWAKVTSILLKCNNLQLDFRDEWAYHPFLPQYHNKLKVRIEKWLFRNAKVCSVSRHISNNMAKRTGFTIDTVYNGPDINFIPLQYDTSVKNDNKNIIVSYTGAMATGCFNVQALAAVVNYVCKVNNTIRFRFIGACEELHKIIPDNPLVEFIGHTSLKEARRLQAESDVLLFIGADFPNNGGIVSAKIFEYLQSYKPILPLFVYKDSDVYNIIYNACKTCPSIFTPNDAVTFFTDYPSIFPSLKNPDYLSQININLTNFFVSDK
jgi:hypothetical protein